MEPSFVKQRKVICTRMEHMFAQKLPFRPLNVFIHMEHKIGLLNKLRIKNYEIAKMPMDNNE